jgi:hypothetical protein
MTREQKLELLAADFAANYAGDNFPNEFKAQGYLTQCNFGGLLVILANSGDGLLCWSDWSDDAVSDKLTECEIEYLLNEDNEDDFQPSFTYQNIVYSLNDVMVIN